MHLLAIAQEAEIDFTMHDIDRLSRVVPQLCKVAPNTNKYHIEDVHRAGGIMAILGELDRAGKLHTDVPTVHTATLKDALDRASGGRSGSPQAALVVNGQIHDYYVSARPAETVLEMIGAARGEWRDPLPRCLQMAPKGRVCVVPAP